MDAFYVFDVMIDAPHITRKLYLPVWIKRVTGVLFFPVVPIPSGAPDGNPLGVAALSLENEKVNIVTNMKVYKKAPCYYEGEDLSDAGGEVFLDRGYGYYDFYSCNDAVSKNSYVLFKYTNSKIIKSVTEFEQFQIDTGRLRTLTGKEVTFLSQTGILSSISFNIDSVMFLIIRKFPGLSISIPISFNISRANLKTEIYKFLDPNNNRQPFFTVSEDEKDYDAPYKLKIILRHEIDK